MLNWNDYFDLQECQIQIAHLALENNQEKVLQEFDWKKALTSPVATGIAGGLMGGPWGAAVGYGLNKGVRDYMGGSGERQAKKDVQSNKKDIDTIQSSLSQLLQRDTVKGNEAIYKYIMQLQKAMTKLQYNIVDKPQQQPQEEPQQDPQQQQASPQQQQAQNQWQQKNPNWQKGASPQQWQQGKKQKSIDDYIDPKMKKLYQL